MKVFRFSTVAALSLVAAAAGVATVWAATNHFADRESENMTKTGTVAAVSDTTASGGAAVKFGVTPVVCPGEPNTPGGEDPWGGCWPGSHNTGYPKGAPGDTRPSVTLTPYTGDCNLNTNNETIDSKTIDCSGSRLRITADNVNITNSLILGRIETPSPFTVNPDYPFSFTLTDTTVAAGDILEEKVIKTGNFTLTRVDVTGASNSVTCFTNCTVIDSWLHDQATDPEGILHVSGLRQGQEGLYRHNSIICEAARGQGAGGACSGAISGYGDYQAVFNNLIEKNLIRAGTSSICVYGGSGRDRPYTYDAHDIRFINNVFEKGASGRCGIYGLVSAWLPELPGNLWSGNTYDDGTPAPDTD